MHSKHKIVGIVARISIGLLVIAGTLVLLARGVSDSINGRAKSQEQSRIVTKKPWRVEPVQIVAAKNKKNTNIEIGKTFDEDDDWLDGFTITVINNSDKTVTAVAVDMIFRRDPGDTRPPFVKELHFGPSPMRPEYNLRDPSKFINVGHTADLQLPSQNYKVLRDILQQKGYSSGIKRVELVIREVGFEDGSVLSSGALYLQDPEHPGDPTKKIRAARKPPGLRNHHTRISLDRKTIKLVTCGFEGCSSG